ncbi:MAG TPA: S41 family peptidase [Chthoniobacterales bacterium]|nr:S41 family peptidase [Chthoniobacterales bacterium]
MKIGIIVAGFLMSSIASGISAQTPTPSAGPSAATEPKVTVDSLAPAEMEETIRTLKSNFVDPAALKDQEIDRATLQGLLTRLHGGVLLLPGKPTNAESPAPFYSEVLGNHIGYVRIGSLSPDNLAALDKAMSDFATKKIDAMVIDLRATSSNDFNLGAEVTKRFVPKGKTLWTLRKTAAHQDRAFTNDRDPVFQGTIMVLLDSETSGPAEAMAAALKAHDQALLIGQPSAGRAVEYSDFPLKSGKVLRVAVAEVIGPNGTSLFPDGVKPDLPVDLSLAQKHQIFSQSAQRGLTNFVFEGERPHFNEAALIAGTNPEIQLRQQQRGPEESVHDSVLQRAVDVITSLTIFQKH